MQKFLQKFLLLGRKPGRGVEVHHHHQVAPGLAAQAGQALAPDAEGGPRLGAGGNFQAGLALQGGHLDFRAQGGFHEGQADLVIEVHLLAGEPGMGGDLHLDEEVAGLAVASAAFPLAPEAQAGPRIHSRGDAHLQGPFLLNQAGALAVLAGGRHNGAGAPALGTGIEDLELPLGLAHLAPAAAIRAGPAFGAGLQTATVARLATDAPLHFDGGNEAPGHFLQGQDHLVPEIGPGLVLIGPVAGAAVIKEIFKHLPEGTEEVFKAAETAQVQAFQTSLAVKVIDLAFFRIRQDLVGFRDAPEVPFRHLVPGVPIRVILQGQAPVGDFDLLRRGGA